MMNMGVIVVCFYRRPIGSPQFEQLRAGRQSNLPTIAEAAVGTPSLSTLVAALKAADLVGPFAGEGQFTVFAPNNDAFAKIPSDALANLLKPENKHALRKVLRRHVIAGWVIKPCVCTNHRYVFHVRT